MYTVLFYHFVSQEQVQATQEKQILFDTGCRLQDRALVIYNECTKPGDRRVH